MSTRTTRRISLAVMMVLLAGIGCGHAAEDQPKTIRPAYVAGSWYPDDSRELADLIDRLCDKASPPRMVVRWKGLRSGCRGARRRRRRVLRNAGGPASATQVLRNAGSGQ